MKRTRSQWDRISLYSSRVRSKNVRHTPSFPKTCALIHKIKAPQPKKEEQAPPPPEVPSPKAEASAPKPETSLSTPSKAEAPSKPKEDKVVPLKEQQSKKQDKSASPPPRAASGSRNETRASLLVLLYSVHS